MDAHCSHDVVTLSEQRDIKSADSFTSTITFVCAKCGAVAPILGPNGPAKSMHIPCSWRALDVRDSKPVAKRSEPVGTNLKTLIASLGTAEPIGCNCESLRQEMDALGVSGCQKHRDRLITALRSNAKRVKWLSRITAAGAALMSGLAFRVNPVDPIPGLFDEALRITMRQSGE